MKESNAISFRLPPLAIEAIKTQLKSGQSVNQFCQLMVLEKLNLSETETTLSRAIFDDMISEMVEHEISRRIATQIIPIVNELQSQLHDLKKQVDKTVDKPVDKIQTVVEPKPKRPYAKRKQTVDTLPNIEN
jgi:hypothetical protein